MLDAAATIELGENSPHRREKYLQADAVQTDVVYSVEEMQKLTQRELAQRLGVCEKTITRWGKLRENPLEGEKQIRRGRSANIYAWDKVQDFIESHRDLVAHAKKFSMTTPEEQMEIFAMADQCREESGVTNRTLVEQIAAKFGRSIETVRYLLKRYAKEHPDSSVAQRQTDRTSTKTNMIVSAFFAGMDPKKMVTKFDCSRQAMDELILAAVKDRFSKLDLDYVGNKGFMTIKPRSSEEGEMLGTMPDSEFPQRKPRVPADMPPYLQALYEIPLLTRKQEQHQFRKMNYLKFKATVLRNKVLSSRCPNIAQVKKVEDLNGDAQAVRNEIIRANLRLVVSIAKRFNPVGEEFFEVVSDGNLSLMNAVDKFDFSRGNKFSTYATWAIVKNFARSIPRETRHHQRQTATRNEDLDLLGGNKTAVEPHDEVIARESELCRAQKMEILFSKLDQRELAVITGRFGLDGEKPQYLKDIGARIGVTKERIRQLENRAMAKLRRAAKENGMFSENEP